MTLWCAAHLPRGVSQTPRDQAQQFATSLLAFKLVRSVAAVRLLQAKGLRTRAWDLVGEPGADAATGANRGPPAYVIMPAWAWIYPAALTHACFRRVGV
jgi:hypothetical protein